MVPRVARDFISLTPEGADICPGRSGSGSGNVIGQVTLGSGG
jgi:hypothetical protein